MLAELRYLEDPKKDISTFGEITVKDVDAN
jgi:hypothetical protein